MLLQDVFYFQSFSVDAGLYVRLAILTEFIHLARALDYTLCHSLSKIVFVYVLPMSSNKPTRGRRILCISRDRPFSSCTFMAKSSLQAFQSHSPTPSVDKATVRRSSRPRLLSDGKTLILLPIHGLFSWRNSGVGWLCRCCSISASRFARQIFFSRESLPPCFTLTVDSSQSHFKVAGSEEKFRAGAKSANVQQQEITCYLIP